MKIETPVEINKPPSEVYKFLMDDENLTLWVKNFVKLERLQGESGQIGATAVHTYNENGRIVEFTEKITANVKNELLQSVIHNEYMEIEITNKLEPVQDHGTLLSAISDLRPKSFIFKILTFFSRTKIRNRQLEDLQRLKDAVESLGKNFE